MNSQNAADKSSKPTTKAVRIPIHMYQLLKEEGARMSRSVPEQMEHMMRLGYALEHSRHVSASDIQKLLTEFHESREQAVSNDLFKSLAAGDHETPILAHLGEEDRILREMRGGKNGPAST